MEAIDWGVRLGKFGGSDMSALLPSPIQRNKEYLVKPTKQGYDFTEKPGEDGKTRYIVDMSRYHEFNDSQCKLIESKRIERIYKKRLRGSSATSDAIKHGNTYESVAMRHFNEAFSMNFDKGKTVPHLSIHYLCATPDGVIINNGLVKAGLEIKCPFNEINHIRSLEHGVISYPYLVQMNYYMWFFGLNRWYFYSFDPDAPKDIKGVRMDIRRDDDIVIDIEFIIDKIDRALKV